jgi:hypothetical protein
MRAIAIVLSFSLGDLRFYKSDIIPIETVAKPRGPLSHQGDAIWRFQDTPPNRRS